MIFYKAFLLKILWSGHFFEMADKGLLSCTSVVGAKS